MSQLMVGGALVGILVGVFGHLISASRRKRVYADGDITSALGANVLGTVSVPHVQARDRRARDRSRLLALGRRLLGLDRPWFLERFPDAGDERGQAVRYRRLASRLHETTGTPLHVLVVVADDDPEALAGVAGLAVATASAGEPTDVITDIPAFADTVARLDAGPARPVVREQADPAAGGRRTVLRLVEVSAELPTVPDQADTAGVVLVTTAGTRTDWQLHGLTQACVDAGHPVLGAMIVHRSRPAAAVPVPTTPPVSISDDALAGKR
jgi:hypothetical protein